MVCVAQLPKLPYSHRWTVLAWLWLLLVVALLLSRIYTYGYGFNLDRDELPGPLLDLTKSGPGVPLYTNQTSAMTTAAPAATRPTMKPNASAKEPAVVLRQGTYVGTTLLASHRYPKAVEAFRGIPYAQDTGGPNRFRPPQPLPDSSDTFDAVEWGKICPSEVSEGVVRRIMSENCLNANIYRPAGLVDRDGFSKERTGQDGSKVRPRLPVIVYVHGGGFNVGHGAERNMASFVAWAKDPMVAVSFNYRVGPLGFLPCEVTARQGLLNLGLRDQQMLLEWVQKNIEAFGGDPKNVTVMGLSAGAHSIGHHIMYYARDRANAPFQRAILESGATTARAVFYPTHPRHLVQFREFLNAAGVADVPESDILSRLRELPLDVILRAGKAVWNKYVPSVTWPFQPVIDGPNPAANSSRADDAAAAAAAAPPLIPDLPIRSWASGTHLRIPLITGFNTNEGTSFIPSRAHTNGDFRAFFQVLIPSLTAADLDALEALYPDPATHPASPYRRVPRGKGRQWARLDAAYAHYAYVCPVLQTAHHMSRAGVADVYVYRFAATAAHGAANHADEAPVVAHDADALRGLPGLRDVADAMHGRFARFAAGTLDVRVGGGDGEEVEWPRFVSPFGEEGEEIGTGKMLVFGEGNDERSGGKSRGVPVRVVEMTELEKAACRFWWERVPLSEGFGRREGSQPRSPKL